MPHGTPEIPPGSHHPASTDSTQQAATDPAAAETSTPAEPVVEPAAEPAPAPETASQEAPAAPSAAPTPAGSETAPAEAPAQPAPAEPVAGTAIAQAFAAAKTNGKTAAIKKKPPRKPKEAKKEPKSVEGKQQIEVAASTFPRPRSERTDKPLDVKAVKAAAAQTLRNMREAVERDRVSKATSGILEDVDVTHWELQGAIDRYEQETDPGKRIRIAHEVEQKLHELQYDQGEKLYRKVQSTLERRSKKGRSIGEETDPTAEKAADALIESGKAHRKEYLDERKALRTRVEALEAELANLKAQVTTGAAAPAGTPGLAGDVSEILPGLRSAGRASLERAFVESVLPTDEARELAAASRDRLRAMVARYTPLSDEEKMARLDALQERYQGETSTAASAAERGGFGAVGPDTAREMAERYRDYDVPAAPVEAFDLGAVRPNPAERILDPEAAAARAEAHLAAREGNLDQRERGLGARLASWGKRQLDAYNNLHWGWKLGIAGVLVGGAALSGLAAAPIAAKVFSSLLYGTRALGAAGMSARIYDRSMEENPTGVAQYLQTDNPKTQAVILGVGYFAATFALGKGAIWAAEAIGTKLGIVDWFSGGHAPASGASGPEGVAAGTTGSGALPENTAGGGGGGTPLGETSSGTPGAETAGITHGGPEAAKLPEITLPREIPSTGEYAGGGHGYEWMLKHLYKDLQSQYLKPEDYAPKPGEAPSDLYRLLTADDASINKVVHDIASDKAHAFFHPDGSNVEIKAGAHMAFSDEGMVTVDGQVHAPEGAPVTPPTGSTAAQLEAHARASMAPLTDEKGFIMNAQEHAPAAPQASWTPSESEQISSPVVQPQTLTQPGITVDENNVPSLVPRPSGDLSFGQEASQATPASPEPGISPERLAPLPAEEVPTVAPAHEVFPTPESGGVFHTTFDNQPIDTNTPHIYEVQLPNSNETMVASFGGSEEAQFNHIRDYLAGLEKTTAPDKMPKIAFASTIQTPSGPQTMVDQIGGQKEGGILRPLARFFNRGALPPPSPQNYIFLRRVDS